MDLRLKNESVFQVVEPSRCGKTIFVTQLLSNSAQYFFNKINKIYWLMGVQLCEEDGDVFKNLKNITFLNGFEEGWMDKPQRGDAIVIDDLFVESPYNTYRNKGLPPTPIASPGIESIEAALHPKQNNYIYYLSDKNGIVHYATTFKQHIENKKIYLNN